MTPNDGQAEPAIVTALIVSATNGQDLVETVSFAASHDLSPFAGAGMP